MFFTPLVYASGYLVLVFLAICMVRRCPCDLSRHSRAACGPSVASAPRGASMQLQGELQHAHALSIHACVGDARHGTVRLRARAVLRKHAAFAGTAPSLF